MNVVGFTFDWISFAIELILVGFPVGLITYLVTKKAFNKRIKELEVRMNAIESKK